MADHLFDYINTIFNKIKKTDKVLLFLDYDGTLVSFKNRPQDVITPDKVKSVLNKLTQNQQFIIFIITGRMLHEIKKLLGIQGLSYAALHGLQIELSNEKSFFWEEAEKIRPLLEKLKETSLKGFKNEKGIYIEDKEFTLAFHYRLLTDEKIKDFVEKFEKIVKENDVNNMLEMIHGAKVVEVRPQGWNKGKAVELILNNVVKTSNILPIYIGDDTTDEDAFRHIGNQGLTIWVTHNSKRTTTAQYWLKDPDEVIVFLQFLSKMK